MHPDEATDHIILYAAANAVPFGCFAEWQDTPFGFYSTEREARNAVEAWVRKEEYDMLIHSPTPLNEEQVKRLIELCDARREPK
jgi:hypothetical protein